MRVMVASTAIALLFGLSPASAMCGGGGQQASAGGMGMCPCCKNMASMGGMKADDPHKGMEMPKIARCDAKETAAEGVLCFALQKLGEVRSWHRLAI